LFPPLGPATLAAFLAPDDEAILLDEHVQSLDLNDRPDLVLIQGYITNAYRAYRIAEHYRARGTFVAMGGLHVTSLPDEAAAHADAVSLAQQSRPFLSFSRSFAAAAHNGSIDRRRGGRWTACLRCAAI
jgi:hypothetical protein